jgi:hypothetical protein
MTSVVRWLAMLAVAILITGCASSGPTFKDMYATLQHTDRELARVYFYRTMVLGAAIQPQVRLNGEPVGKAVPKGFFYVDRPAGRYVVSTSSGTERQVAFVLAPGETRYVRLNIAMGLLTAQVYPEPVDRTVGLSEIADLHYVGDTQP